MLTPTLPAPTVAPSDALINAVANRAAHEVAVVTDLDEVARLASLIVARNVDSAAVAEHLDMSDLATEVDMSDLANALNVWEIANEIDVGDVASEVVDRIDLDEVAERLDLDDLARRVRRDLPPDAAERLERVEERLAMLEEAQPAPVEATPPTQPVAVQFGPAAPSDEVLGLVVRSAVDALLAALNAAAAEGRL